jgi:hypothetical protein
MRKKATDTDDVRPEYGFASMNGGVRGKYVRRLQEGTNIVLIEPKIAAASRTDMPYPAARFVHIIRSVNQAGPALYRPDR